MKNINIVNCDLGTDIDADSDGYKPIPNSYGGLHLATAIKNIPSQKVKYSEILGIPLVDDIPTEGSNNLVTSNGIFEGIRNSIDTITEEDIDTIIGGE